MSEIRATTISDAAGTGPITLTGQSAAKAWIDHSSAAVVNDSLNVSSLTDNSTGNHTVNLTNSFNAATSYAVSVTAMDDGVGNGNGVHTSLHPASKLSGAWRHNQYGWSGSWYDLNTYALAIGDLA